MAMKLCVIPFVEKFDWPDCRCITSGNCEVAEEGNGCIGSKKPTCVEAKPSV